jgi:CubicO group peptidase (beta-lactamase class C family)
MVHTAYLGSDELPGDVALGYLLPDGHRTNVFQVRARGSGDGGAYTTAADVHRFWVALLAGIVPLGLVEQALRPRPPQSGSAYAYGLGVWLADDGATVIMEGSDPGASFPSLHYRLAHTTVTVLSNLTEPHRGRPADRANDRRRHGSRLTTRVPARRCRRDSLPSSGRRDPGDTEKAVERQRCSVPAGTLLGQLEGDEHG